MGQFRKFARTLVVVVTLALCLPVFVACGGGNGANNNTGGYFEDPPSLEPAPPPPDVSAFCDDARIIGKWVDETGTQHDFKTDGILVMDDNYPWRLAQNIVYTTSMGIESEYLEISFVSINQIKILYKYGNKTQAILDDDGNETGTYEPKPALENCFLTRVL